MTPPSDKCAAPAPAVVTIPVSLVAELRNGLWPMIGEVALKVSVLVEQSGEINAEAVVTAFRHLDALRALLNKVTARGVRPKSVTLTEADHPALALEALESEYRNRLSRAEDAESMGFTASTRLLVELGALVAALRERLRTDQEGGHVG